jgi:hypothetical protein
MFFNIYTVLLMVSGVLLIVTGAAISGQGALMRVLNILIGLGFLGYGLYLEFIFDGDSYRVFFYAFIAPIVLLVRTFQARKASRQAGQAQSGQAQSVQTQES